MDEEHAGRAGIPHDGTIPVAPTLDPWIPPAAPLERARKARILVVTALAIGIALVAGVAAQGLSKLIGAITNLAFYGRWSFDFASPAGHSLGLWVVLVPVIGALIVGVMARYGSAAIRGHGIPEAMEQVLFNQSRIPARMVLLKPLSAAISIGTGGPFGAEGPIIATGGSLGSLVGQALHTTADERKVLLAAGAAAGMAATFGSPVSAVLLAIELLLFEYRPRSMIPVALAAATAAAVRAAFVGSAPVFAIEPLAQPGGGALALYVLIGALVGLASVGVTRSVYWVEDRFELLPLHWMWWPAIGAVAVGAIGFFAPRTLGVGYDNIEDILAGRIAGTALAVLCIAKFVSWAIALGSGTSGGTLAPLFTIGGAIGALLGSFAARVAPSIGCDPRLAALVGTAAMFAGASHALLASVVFAFETTRDPAGLLPLLAGGAAAFLVARMTLQNSIMTEKIARRGARVPSEYSADPLEQLRAGDVCRRAVVALEAERPLDEVVSWIRSGVPGSSHQGFPVVEQGRMIGVVTRRDLLGTVVREGATVGTCITRAPVVLSADASLREAADLMVIEGIGRLPVVDRASGDALIGILTRSDLIEAHRARLLGETRFERTLGVPKPAR